MRRLVLLIVVMAMGLVLANVFVRKGQQPEPANQHAPEIIKQDVAEERQHSREEKRPYEPREVKLEFKPFKVDIARYYVTEENRKRMEEEEEKYQKGEPGTIAQNNANTQKEFKTSVGVFRVVTSFGRHSINAAGYHHGGWRMECLQLPSGQWMRAYPGPFSITVILELDGKVYLVTSTQIYEWVDEKTLQAVVCVDDHKSHIKVSYDTNDGRLCGRYFEIHRSNSSDFGGLLEYADGKWLFRSYMGKHPEGWIEFTERDHHNKLVFTLFHGWDHQKRQPTPKIQFDPTTGTFNDL